MDKEQLYQIWVGCEYDDCDEDVIASNKKRFFENLDMYFSDRCLEEVEKAANIMEAEMERIAESEDEEPRSWTISAESAKEYIKDIRLAGGFKGA